MSVLATTARGARDPRTAQRAVIAAAALAAGNGQLAARDVEILRARAHRESLEAIGRRLRISGPRVRQLETIAVQRALGDTPAAVYYLERFGPE